MPSGENQAVVDQAELLANAGQEVILVARYSDTEERSRFFAPRAAIRTVTGHGGSPVKELKKVRPDVVHVHNLFPNFGTSWLSDWAGPVLATLHNYRPICANGLLFRDGRTCFDCPSGRPSSAVVHRCYHGSGVRSLPLAIRNARGLAHNPLFQRADTLIVLSEAARTIYGRYGAPSERLTVLPNGIRPSFSVAGSNHNGRWLYVGRLSEEKGALELVRSWPNDRELDLVGSGPLEEKIRDAASSGVRLLGPRSRREVRDLMPNYEGLVFPSRCLEMQPSVVIEAMGAGIPVVALRGNAGADLLLLHGGGSVYGSKETLREALLTASRGRTAIGKRGREVFAKWFSSDSWVSKVLPTYAELIR